ncbi:MAG: tetratricopeptide repeat protein, partial [Bacteroidota bacterium]
MKNHSIIILVFVFLLCSIPQILEAQSVRSLNNSGVDLYEKEKYSDAEVNFKKSIEKDFESFEGHFNLGDALYKQERYEESLEAYKNAYMLTKDDYQKSKALHNIGNSLLKSQKLKESVEAYKGSLKLDPDDLETKYNLSYALNMMKNQQQKQEQNQDKKENEDKNEQKQ